MAKDLWALDFDGVVCNSVGESSQSAWKVCSAVTGSPLHACLANGLQLDMGLIMHGCVQASARKWPELFAQPEVQAREAEILQKMRTVRPVVETGWVGAVLRVHRHASAKVAAQSAALMSCRYENLVQVRCLLDGTTEDDMLQNWHTLLPDSMARWQLDRSEVQTAHIFACPVTLVLGPPWPCALHPLAIQNMCSSWWSYSGAPGMSGLRETWRGGLKPTRSMRACLR